MRTPTARRRRVLAALTAAAAAVALATPLPASAAPADAAVVALHPGAALAGRTHDDGVGFSVESADLAHGFLTRKLLTPWLHSISPHGVLRVGGYSMDLVWPAFGAYRDTIAPPEAIGGTVDQSDLDKLAGLLRATGWRVTLGLPLKKLIDPSKIKDPTKDPSPAVTRDQVIAEVRAAQRTLGSRLVAVEIGNEYDNVTTLTPAEYYTELKTYSDAIDAAVGPHVKVIGPSANTAVTNTQLDGFVAAVAADAGDDHRRRIAELSNHLYPGSHCGTSTLSIPTLLSAKTHDTVQQKVTGIVAITGRLHDGMPATLNETNSASCSGMPGVSDAYATTLWSLDHVLQAEQAGIRRLQFHTNTAAMCGDFQPRTSPNYPISYRYYGAFCARNQAALGRQQLSASPLFLGLRAASSVPVGRFVDLGLPADRLGTLRAYGVRSGRTLTVVLIDLRDPATSTGAQQVSVPGRAGHARELRTTDPAGLASTDASRIVVGPRYVRVSGGKAVVDLRPGSAQVVTLRQ